jgi:hypothetical protein
MSRQVRYRLNRVVATVVFFACATAFAFGAVHGADPQPALRLGTFDVDASPPVGSPLAYDPCKKVLIPLTCRGVVLLPGGEKPIVLCSVDWIGIGNGGQKEFKSALAAAAGTEPERVAVHVVHQHDAPRCDFSIERLLAEHGLGGKFYDVAFLRSVIERAAAAAAAKAATRSAQPVTHIGLGQAAVEKVASNRRILGPDGKVKYTRWTACRDPKIRAMPVGTIDPQLKMISFWNGEKCLVALSYYACHPQSYYRTGEANPDFPGIARNMRQEATGVLHIHFDGAGGDIGAGKWNDGSHENRRILANRLADAMARAWSATQRRPVQPGSVRWRTVKVLLPVADHLDEAKLRATLEDESVPARRRHSAAGALVWLKRCLRGEKIDIGCLYLPGACVLHMPGELLVEYQLAAQRMRPDLFVAMAAYGDYAMGYIGTRVAYEQGGYETSERASLVAPEVEDVLMKAMHELLEVTPSRKQ